MNMAPEEAVKQFADIYQKKYGIKLTPAEASFRANNLLNLYKAVYINSIAEPEINKNNNDYANKPIRKPKDK